MTQPLLLGIDIGTTAAKAALFTLDGHLHSLGQAEYPIHHLRPGWVEQNPEDWWHAACAAIHEALASSGGETHILGAAISSQSPVLLALDHAGTPIRPAMIWMDRRADQQVEALNARFGARAIYDITGNRADSFYIAPKLLWLREHEPETLERARQFIQVNGYIAYRLTGEFSLDPAHGAMLQLRDCRAETWSDELCQAVGVRPDQFPPVLPGHTQLGVVTAEGAAATGLPVGTPVMVGTADGSAAALEAGAVDPGTAAEMTGTSTVLIMPSQTLITDPALIAMPHAVPGMHLLLAATVASGANLRWFRDQFAAVETAEAAQTGADVFDLLTEAAARHPIGSGGVIFLPYMMGERAPLWHSQARGVFFGLSLAHERASLVRAILEGTSFALRHNVEVARAAGMPVDEILAVGGGARSPLWCQIKADVLGIPLALPHASVGAPFGDALLVGLGLGIYDDIRASVRRMIHIKERYEPVPEAHERYTAIYALFRDLYVHLRDDFDRAARIYGSI